MCVVRLCLQGYLTAPCVDMWIDGLHTLHMQGQLPYEVLPAIVAFYCAVFILLMFSDDAHSSSQPL